MKIGRFLVLCGAVVAAALSGPAGAQAPSPAPAPYVRIAQLEIDPAHMAEFVAIVSEEMEIATRVEPGCLGLYAVAEKDSPNRVTVLEVYADEAAYRTHLQTPHFQKFTTSTRHMVTSRRLMDAVPLMLSSKPR